MTPLRPARLENQVFPTFWRDCRFPFLKSITTLAIIQVSLTMTPFLALLLAVLIAVVVASEQAQRPTGFGRRRGFIKREPTKFRHPSTGLAGMDHESVKEVSARSPKGSPGELFIDKCACIMPCLHLASGWCQANQ